SYRRAIALDPAWALAHVNLGSALKDQGKLRDAAAELKHATELRPDESKFHSNLLYLTWFDPDLSTQEILDEHRIWYERHAAPLPSNASAACWDGSRPLRLGYVSPDFREHVVGRLIEPVLKHHNADVVETFCYSDVIRPDALTARIKSYASHWRDTHSL